MTQYPLAQNCVKGIRQIFLFNLKNIIMSEMIQNKFPFLGIFWLQIQIFVGQTSLDEKCEYDPLEEQLVHDGVSGD